MATISEVAIQLGVDRETVKRWTIEFAEHLSLKARPQKGTKRQFGEADLRVLALVAHYWEEDPDLSYIHAMLNSGDFNDECFSEFAALHNPVFQEPPDELDESWQHGVIIGGMAGRNLLQVARAYKMAADELIEAALRRFKPHQIDYPIFFLYRHSIEIYLKAMLNEPPKKNHDLGSLIRRLEQQQGLQAVLWVRDRLWDFHKIDQQSDLFRYDELPSDCELWIDFHHLKLVMDRLTEAFEHYICQNRIEFKSWRM